MGQSKDGKWQVDVASFVHPQGANDYVTHEEVKKEVLASVQAGYQVQAMVWRDKESGETCLISSDTDFDLVCKHVRDKLKRVPLFTVLVALKPPTVPPPKGSVPVEIK